MAQQRRGVEGGEVADVVDDLQPVRVVEEGTRQVRTEAGEGVGPPERSPDPDDHQHGEERRQQPPRPTEPELAEVDATLALVLFDEQRRDEEAGHDEEHLDTEEPALEPPVAGPVERVQVVQHHGDHRHRPQAVEAGDVPHRRSLPTRRRTHTAHRGLRIESVERRWVGGR